MSTNATASGVVSEAVASAPASSLPTVSLKHNNDYYRSAFRRSVLWQPAEQRLCVRREYLGSVGDVLPLLIHSLAHLKVNDMARDVAEEMLTAHPDLAERHLQRWLGSREELLKS